MGMVCWVVGVCWVWGGKRGDEGREGEGGM